jgi:uncharacterized protein involved in outer membrane biogenesis
MRTFKIVCFVLIGLVLLAVAAVVALIFVDPSVYRNQLETRASAAFGREFKIDGPIHLERSLRPRIIVEDISIGNPAWATGTHFATAEKVGVQVALFPLLRGELGVLDVAFSGVNLYIEESPDGANNYTFGDGGESETPGVLPPVERLQVKNTVINYRTADGSSKRFEIKAARLWNIPGEPERIEAEGSTKGMTFTILLAADNAAELSGPQNPWSVKVDINGPDMSLNLAGRMEEAFIWQRGDYRIQLSGDHADYLETLFDMDLPTSGPFKLSANVNKTEGAFRVTEISAQVEGPPEIPAIKISDGEASGGQDDPLQLALQGQIDETPFTLKFASTQLFEGISQKKPWPIEAQLNLADLKLNIAGEMIPATVTEHLEFNAQLQGESLGTLAQLLDTELPQAGPYRFSFHTQIAKGSINVTELKGSIEQAGLWQTLGVEQGNVSVKETGSVAASLDAMLDKAPLSLTFEGGPKAPEGTWPLKLEASATGATIKGDGAVVTTEKGKVLQIATHISGNRFESLGPLLGTSLPAIGKFDLRADVSSDGDVHAAGNLQIQIRKNRLTGIARWEDKAPRPVLSGKLSAKRLSLSDFKTPSKTPSKSGRPGLLDRPIKLDALNAFDARLDLTVKDVTDSPIAVTDVKSTISLTNGELNAPFRASIKGIPVKGQIDLRQRNDISNILFNATAGKIDAAQILKQLKMPEMVSGTTDAVELKASSTGKTLRALLEQAAFSLQLKPADLSYTFEIAGQPRDFMFSDVELAARRNEPLAAVFEGTLNGIPFSGDVSTANLREIQKSNSPLPLRVTIKQADLDFKAEGTVERPFKKNSFELQYELSGKEIQGLDPLADFAVPLRGEFIARGRIAARGNRFTYAEDLRVGKSDLRANITIVREPPRPKISGSITASQIHLDDINLVDADKEAAQAEDKPFRVIPDYTLPVDVLLAADVDVDFRAERIRAPRGDLGEFVMKISLTDGRFESSTSVTGFKGAQISSEFDLNAATQPPVSTLWVDAKDLNFAYLLGSMGVTDEIIEGSIDLRVDLSGAGATRYDFLGNAEGRITIIGGPGRMTGRRIDLWAADLIPTMLSTQWQRENVTETNCLVAHIEVGEGRAEIEDLLLDTQRITIAASGVLDLETEKLDIYLAPRPKRASLVSLANPVRIRGTLAEPEVSVTRIPRGRRLAGAGLLAGLVNPAFLIFALSDVGTGQANPCEAVVEQAREAAGINSQESQNTN